jgi:hypothetical protein
MLDDSGWALVEAGAEALPDGSTVISVGVGTGGSVSVGSGDTSVGSGRGVPLGGRAAGLDGTGDNGTVDGAAGAELAP